MGQMGADPASKSQPQGSLLPGWGRFGGQAAPWHGVASAQGVPPWRPHGQELRSALTSGTSPSPAHCHQMCFPLPITPLGLPPCDDPADKGRGLVLYRL